MSREFTAIDLFCGAGGLSIGLQKAGFSILAANDIDPPATRTYRAAHPETEFLHDTVEAIQGRKLLRSLSLKKGELDLLAGGPPCQGFSVYNHKRGYHDPRSQLFLVYLRLIAEILPKVVIIENVTGLSSVENGRIIQDVHDALSSIGYYVEHRVLRAEEFGIPQERRRLFFIGTKVRRGVDWPVPTHGSAGNSLFDCERLPLVTCDDTLSDLPILANGQGFEPAQYRSAPASAYQKLMRLSSGEVYNHIAPKLSTVNLERMRYIPPGGSWRDIPHDLLPTGMKRAKRSDHTKRYGRLLPSGQSSTILTKCDIHWGAYIHPTQDRTLTVREAARFQSFPDSVRFCGSRVEQYKQVGNAVPPLLAEVIGRSVMRMLASVSTRGLQQRAVG